MGCSGIIFRELKDEPVHVKLAFLMIELLANCKDTMWKGQPIAAGEFITSRANFARMCSISEKQARNAWIRLEEMELITTTGEGKRYTRVALLTSAHQKGQEKGQEKGQQKTPKKQRESKNRGQEKGQEKGHSVVDVNHAVRSSSDVDVSPSVQRQEGNRAHAREAPSASQNFKSKATSRARYEAAVTRAPDLPHVIMHIDRLFADLSEGHKYPWAGNPTAATQLADLIFSHQAPLVIAAAEKFFTRDDSWTEKRAWAIDEFSRQFARLIAIPGTSRRAAKIATELQTQGRPSTPRELREQLAAMRRREQEAMRLPEPTDDDRAHARQVVAEYRGRRGQLVPA